MLGCGGRAALVLALLVVAFVPGPAVAAAPQTQLFTLPPAPLPVALKELARQARIELLFNEELLAGRTAPPLSGRFTAEAALERLIAGTGFELRRTAGGAFVINKDPDSAPSPRPEAEPVPEILVVGRRTQNADIRRTERDIQPYRVLTRPQVRQALRDNLDQVIRAREPANTQMLPASLSAAADSRSEFNMRGLGTERTLVLVDGRRMPSVPATFYAFLQPDVNGIPLSAIDRVETRTGTSGGIYGPGAIGGVLNVVLRRDYEGAELRVTSGITSRGDSPFVGLEGSLGFSLGEGRTNIMLFGGYRTSEPLRVGDRDFLQRQRQLQFANNSADYLRRLPTSNAVTVSRLDGRDLMLRPEYGDGSLGSSFTFLPVGFAGSEQQSADLLRANAGRLVFEPADDFGGAKAYLMPNPEIWSGSLNIRHSFSDAVEGYVDALVLGNRAELEAGGQLPVFVSAAAPTNPFTSGVQVRFPWLSEPFRYTQRLDTFRFTGGLIVRLPRDWSANLDLAIGSAELTRPVSGPLLSNALLSSAQRGMPGASGEPVIAPLGPWTDLVSAVAAYFGGQYFGDLRLINRFTDASLRLAGPLADLGGGPVTGTLLLEHRREHVPASARLQRFTLSGISDSMPVPERRQRVTTVHGELRAPLTGTDPPVPFLSNLELQLALRYDRFAARLPDGVGGYQLGPDELHRGAARDAVTYTAGLKFSPIRGVLLRASLATGEMPPSLTAPYADSMTLRPPRNSRFADPQRGGRLVGSEEFIRLFWGSGPDSPPERAATLSFGAVLDPTSSSWPRISVDFTRIRTSREPFSAGLGVAATRRVLDMLVRVLADEARYPGRITRDPLTPGDQALGFAGGVATRFDARGLLLGNTVIEAVDMGLDWTLPAGRAGTFRLYGTATWMPTYRRRITQFERWVQLHGDADGPLRWRGHAGVDWTSGPLSFGVNAQYFDSHRATYADEGRMRLNADILRNQGTDHIPPQLYVDVSARRRIDLPKSGFGTRRVEIGFGIVNLFDRSPPIDADTGNVYGYDFYGDPRRRRFELSLSAGF